MTTDGVIFAVLTPCGDHIHLEWVCCDCGAFCFIGCQSRYRHVCAGTGREFLVIGIPIDTNAAGIRLFRRSDATL